MCRRVRHKFISLQIVVCTLTGGGKSSQVCCPVPRKLEGERDAPEEDRENRSSGTYFYKRVVCTTDADRVY